MVLLSAFIGVVGLYFIAYVNHLADVKSYKLQLEMEEFHKAENHIKYLHSKGNVFNSGDILS